MSEVSFTFCVFPLRIVCTNMNLCSETIQTTKYSFGKIYYIQVMAFWSCYERTTKPLYQSLVTKQKVKLKFHCIVLWCPPVIGNGAPQEAV